MEGKAVPKPEHVSGLVSDGIARVEAVISMALRGNPATDAAVACMIRGRKTGRRVGPMTNCRAAYAAVEHALEVGNGTPLLIITCSGSVETPTYVGSSFADIGARIDAKRGKSLILWIKKKEDPRFDIVQEFARRVLNSGDPIWTPSPVETAQGVQKLVEKRAFEKTESPPESAILRALLPEFPVPIAFEIDPVKSPGYVVPAFSGDHGVLIPQLKIGDYRADFGIVADPTRLVVEVDGFTYHSSRESFESDRRRDREMMLAGWVVMRFPASEATYEPQACADQVIEFLESKA